MTQDEVRTWALGHGFSERPDGRLETDYGETVVAIAFSQVNVRVTQSKGDHERTVLSARPNRAYVNEFGVLEGLGLSASFLTPMMGDPDAVPPPWMPQAYLDAIGWTGQPAEQPGSAPGP